MVQRWLILFCLLGYNILISTQPLSEESTRNARGASGYDFVECCPCPKSGDERVGDAACSVSSGVGCMVDSVGRSRDPDSEVSPSSDFQSQGHGHLLLLRSDDLREERMPILKPEVDLASSLLETIREATEEEYIDAVARDAARNAANAREPDPSASTSNIVIIVDTPERGDLADAVQEASQIEEARWTEVPPNNLGTNLDSDVGASNRNDNIEDMGSEKNVLAANDILKSVKDRIESVRNSLNIKRIPEWSKKADSNILGNYKPALPNLKDLARNNVDLTPQSSIHNDISQQSLKERLRNNPLIKNIHNLKDVELIPPQRNAADKNKIPNLTLPSLFKSNNENTENNGLNLFHLPTLDELLHPPTTTTIKFDTKPSQIQEPGNQIENDKIDILDALPGESQNNIVTTKAESLSENTENCNLEGAKQNENVDLDDFLNDSADGLDSLESIENGSTENIQLDEINGDNFDDSVETQDSNSNISNDSQEFSEQNDAIPEPSTTIFETIPDVSSEKKADQLREKDPCISDLIKMPKADDISDTEAKSSESSLLDNINGQIKKLKDIHALAKNNLRNILNKRGDVLKKTTSDDKEVTLEDLQKMSDSLLDSSHKVNRVTDLKSSENTTPELTRKESTQILNEVNQSTEKETHSVADNCKSDIFLQNSEKNEPEMETGSSDAIMNIARPNFKTRPSLRRDFIVQPSFLRRDNDVSLLDLPTLPSIDLPSFDLPTLPSLDLPSFDLPTLPPLDLPSLDLSSLNLPSLDLPTLPALDVPTLELPRLDMPSLELPRLDVPSLDLPSLDLPSLPSLDEIRDGIQNLFDSADTPSLMQRASEGLGSSLLPSASSPQKQTVLRPLDEINFDIFQLNPSALSRSSSRKNSLQPGFNLNSYRARVPLPNLQQLQPLNLQSTTRNNGKVLGATISMKPKSGSRKSFKNKQSGSEPLFALHDHLRNLPSLGEMRDTMRSRAQNILESAPPLLSAPLAASPLGIGEPESLASIRENLRSNAEDTFNNIQKTIAASVQQARERNGNMLGTSKFAQPENVLENFALARENLDETLKALHTDFNDRLSSIHADGKAALSKTLKKTNLSNSNTNIPKRKTNKKKKLKPSKPVISRGESKKSESILLNPHSKPLQRSGVNKLRSEAPIKNNKKTTSILNSPQPPKINKARTSLSDLINKHTSQTSTKDSRIPKTKADSILSSTNEKTFFKPKPDNRESNTFDSIRKNILKDTQDIGRSPFLAQRTSFNEMPSLAKTIDDLKPKMVIPNLTGSDFLKSTLERNSENQNESFWPKSRVPDTSLLSKFRESVKSLSEYPLLSAPSRLTETKTVKDLIQGASERAASTLAAGPALKENVSYKCKFVCVRDDE